MVVVVLLVLLAGAGPAAAQGPVLAGQRAVEVGARSETGLQVTSEGRTRAFGRVAPLPAPQRNGQTVLDVAASERTLAVTRLVWMKPPVPGCMSANPPCSMPDYEPTPRRFELRVGRPDGPPRVVVVRERDDVCRGKLVPTEVEVSGRAVVVLETGGGVGCPDDDDFTRYPRATRVVVRERGRTRVLAAERGVTQLMELRAAGRFVAWRRTVPDNAIEVAELRTGRPVLRVPIDGEPVVGWDLDEAGRLALIYDPGTQYPCGPNRPVGRGELRIASPQRPRVRATGVRVGSPQIALARGRLLHVAVTEPCREPAGHAVRDLRTGTSTRLSAACAPVFSATFASAFDGALTAAPGGGVCRVPG